MPATTMTETRWQSLAPCLTLTVETLQVLARTLNTPFLGVITSTAQSVLKEAESARQHKATCVQLTEQVHQIMCRIIIAHDQCATGYDLPPQILHHIGKFAQLLQSIYTFIHGQQERKMLRNIFRQNEMNALLKSCYAGLEEALDAFKVDRLALFANAADMHVYAEERHRQVLELINSLSEAGFLNDTSSVSQALSSRNTSSGSFGLLPPRPSIFHGRSSEMAEILRLLSQGSSRLAILGPGGMGKTSLARAVLQHEDIKTKFGRNRFFVACESATDREDLLAVIGAHLGLEPQKNLSKAVIQSLSGEPCLMILDNLETCWEPAGSRRNIEDVLSLLSQVEDLSLIITMRGAERPANVNWTRPFLRPLEPLSSDAAQRIFFDIADDVHEPDEVIEVLALTDNIPLVVHLVAHLVDTEGCSSVLLRWEAERTSLISQGYDHVTNLGLSISLSLSSPRITSQPRSRDLLSLLSILPDGLTDSDLIQSQVPIDNILACKAALVRTSLAYLTADKRIKILVPIREYIREFYPPANDIVEPVYKHLQSLWNAVAGVNTNLVGVTTTPTLISRIRSNLANFQSLLLRAIYAEEPDIDSIYLLLRLNHVSRLITYGPVHPIEKILDHLPHPRDPQLVIAHLIERINSWRSLPIKNCRQMIADARELFRLFADPIQERQFYQVIGDYYIGHDNDLPAALEALHKSLALAIAGSHVHTESELLFQFAWLKWQSGDYSGARIHATKSHTLAQSLGDLFYQARALRIEGMCWHAKGNYSEAAVSYREGRHLLQICGLSGGASDLNFLNSEADLRYLKSEYLEARGIQMDILNLTGDKLVYLRAHTLLEIAGLDVVLGASECNVQETLDRAKQALVTLRDVRGLEISKLKYADLALRERRILEASELLLNGLRWAWGQDSESVNFCLERLANRRLWEVGTSNLRWPTVLLGHSLNKNQQREIHKALQFFGDIFLWQGDEATASSLYAVALEGFTLMDIHHSKAECMLQLGHIACAHGDVTRAADMWTGARPLFERSSAPKEIADIDEQLQRLRSAMIGT